MSFRQDSSQLLFTAPQPPQPPRPRLFSVRPPHLRGLTSDLAAPGHRWLKHHLNATVRTGWSVDPFGHGSTMPYLLRRADIKQTVIMVRSNALFS